MWFRIRILSPRLLSLVFLCVFPGVWGKNTDHVAILVGDFNAAPKTENEKVKGNFNANFDQNYSGSAAHKRSNKDCCTCMGRSAGRQ